MFSLFIKYLYFYMYLIYFFKWPIYLKGRVSEGYGEETVTDTELFYSVQSQCLHQLGLGQAEAMGWRLHLVLPHEWKESKSLSHHLLFLRFFRKMTDQKQRRHCIPHTPRWDSGIPSGGLTCCKYFRIHLSSTKTNLTATVEFIDQLQKFF